jgi:carbon-monoxide dehydrogenase large subunit
VKNRLYPEDALAAYLAMRTGRPVKWVGDRREEFLSTNQERDQVHEAALGVRRDGTIVALVDHFVQDNGAYCMAGLVVPETTCVSLPGPYRVPNIAVEGVVVLTNKVPVSPYRGAGRPQGTFVMERLLDLAADALGQSRVAIRDANLLRPQDLPYRSGVRYRDVPLEIREGDFPAIMHAALDHLELQDLAREKADLARQGRLLGLGLANYLEISSGLGFEGAKVRLAEDGMIEIASGSASQGQGHPTMLAQIAADRLGVEMERIRVIEGDTGAIARGIGTFGSRTTVMAGNAVSAAARVFREKLLAEAAERLEASPADLVLRDGAVYVEGVPARALLLSTLAADEALRDRLTVEHYYQTEEPALGMGTHAVLVEIDRETLALRLRRYVIVHDAGVVVNPLSADGQTIGAAVQGLGTTLYEELHLDESGQPLNTSFMDYLLPGAVEMPDFEIHEREFPATSNPEGFKGLAEGGIMPPMAAVLSAVEDALAIPGLHLEEIPVTPAKLHALLSRLGVRP